MTPAPQARSHRPRTTPQCDPTLLYSLAHRATFPLTWPHFSRAVDYPVNDAPLVRTTHTSQSTRIGDDGCCREIPSSPVIRETGLVQKPSGTSRSLVFKSI